MIDQLTGTGWRRCRLTARAQIDGEVRETGYVFTLTYGERGPHRTVVASNADGMAWRLHQSRAELELIPAGFGWVMPEAYTPEMRDEPLFEVIEDN
jgi:hypothetical protein